jgi:hypothetical protein
LGAEQRFALIRAVGVLFQKWELTDYEQRKLLGLENKRDLSEWQPTNVDTLTQDAVSRLTDLIRIHRSLRTIFIDPNQGYAWIKRPNEIFSGESALEVMLLEGAAGITRVRAYLDAEIDG